MPGSSKQIRAEIERRFPARLCVAIPEGGMGRRMTPLHHWLDATCSREGWATAPAGIRGISDAVAYYFRDVTLAAAFVRRWCDGFAEFPGLFKFREDEPTPAVYRSSYGDLFHS